MKKIVILEANKGGQLANQLWNYISIYAYCIEKGYECDNWCFYFYRKHFPNIKTKNYFIKYIFEEFLLKMPFKKRSLYGRFYSFYAMLVKFFNKDNIVSSGNTKVSGGGVFYLPPTDVVSKENETFLSKIGNSDDSKFFFQGWLFRNPVGIKRYRKEIVENLKPSQEVERSVDDKIKKIRKKYDLIVGVHIRQRDYRHWRGGEFYYSPEKFDVALNDFKSYYESKGSVCFVVCSDEEIDQKKFTNVDFVFGPGDMIGDLFILSKTDFIIGTNSTFGALASYLGDIPFKVMKNERKYNWSFYLNKEAYFENRDCTVVCY